MRRFAGHEFVRVINIDDQPFYWQYLPSFAEEFEFTPDPMKITRRAGVEAYRLDPGESEVLIGENAYVMIEALYKKLRGKEVIERNPNTPAGVARAFGFDDDIAQEQLIKKIYLGKETPGFSKGRSSATVVAPKPIRDKSGRIRKVV